MLLNHYIREKVSGKARSKVPGLVRLTAELLHSRMLLHRDTTQTMTDTGRVKSFILSNKSGRTGPWLDAEPKETCINPMGEKIFLIRTTYRSVLRTSGNESCAGTDSQSDRLRSVHVTVIPANTSVSAQVP